MELSKNDIKMTKGVAILFMLLLHLFCRKDVHGLYDTFPMIHGVPFIYYIGLFGDACVPIYCFASGYGLYVSFKNSQGSVLKKNFLRIFKLLINYWIVIVMFITIGFYAGKADIYPGDPVKFLLNFFALSNSYNGAWWFVQTYIILAILAPMLTKIINKYNSIIIVVISGVIYLLSYIQRIKHVVNFGDGIVVSMIINALVLVGTSQLPFVIGVVFAKKKIYSKINNVYSRLNMNNFWSLAGIFLLVLMHSFYESMIIAPITGIAFIIFFNLLDKKAVVQKLFDFFGNHSTNIWLTHMFFYMTIFPSITFAPKYPVFIFGWLLIMTLISSYIINLIYKPLIRLIDSKTNIDKKYSEAS